MIADRGYPDGTVLTADGGIAADATAPVCETGTGLRRFWGRAFAASLAAAISGGVLALWPSTQVEVFCRGAAAFAGLLTGLPTIRVDTGWLLPAALPVVVTHACSGTSYFVLLTALLGWHFARRKSFVPLVAIAAVASALPLSIGINGLRIAALLQVHRWLIPRFPPSYGPFFHLLVGVAIFLPALILINLVSEIYGRPSSRPGNRQSN